jgi:hypothetical protein
MAGREPAADGGAARAATSADGDAAAADGGTAASASKGDPDD